MDVREHDVALPGGRTLHVYESGDPAGLAVVAHHGTPDCGRPYGPVVEDAAARGIRFVSYDRPGYGGSTPAPGRRVADAAGDVLALGDALGFDRFATWGVSGGGPHALACAALGGGRCVGAASIAGVAPFDAEGLNYFAGMGRDNLVEFGAALVGREALAERVARDAEAMLGASPAELLESIGTLVSPPDAAVLDGPFGEHWAAATPAAFAQGVTGWVDDDLVFLEPFGFDPADIAVPVLVRHGRQDRFVPVSHGEWLARRIPGADVRITIDDGHLTLVALGVGEVHDWLVRRF